MFQSFYAYSSGKFHILEFFDEFQVENTIFLSFLTNSRRKSNIPEVFKGFQIKIKFSLKLSVIVRFYFDFAECVLFKSCENL